jgi:5-methylcytosine-specific restriction endonuclease McrA
MLFENGIRYYTCRTCGWGICVDERLEDIYKKGYKGITRCPYCAMGVRRVRSLSKESLEWFYARSPIGDPSNRRYIPPRVRKAVSEKYNFTCVYCGSKEKLEIDHIIPLCSKGTNEADNLQVLCKACNISKSDGDNISKKRAMALEYQNKMREMFSYIRQSCSHLKSKKRVSMAEIARVSGVKYETVLVYRDEIQKELGLSEKSAIPPENATVET